MEYSKGEWEAVGPCVRDEEHIEICTCSMYQKSPNSNAHLIAAAPEMDKAIRHAEIVLRNLKASQLGELTQQQELCLIELTEAIAKTEGK